MLARVTLVVWATIQVAAQTPPTEQPDGKKTPSIRYVESGKGVVGVGVVGRWLLGSRHAFSLSGPTDNPAGAPERTHAPTPN